LGGRGATDGGTGSAGPLSRIGRLDPQAPKNQRRTDCPGWCLCLCLMVRSITRVKGPIERLMSILIEDELNIVRASDRNRWVLSSWPCPVGAEREGKKTKAWKWKGRTRERVARLNVVKERQI